MIPTDSRHKGSPTVVPSQKSDSGGVGWRVETLNAPVDTELEGLSGCMRAKFVHIAELLGAFGPASASLCSCVREKDRHDVAIRHRHRARTSE